ncbi:hypothetical protein HBH92_214590 [Parastagonospora nodorum]|nr:hypothetical protein HBH92_214590 [Parastagonospora nodorum]KAH4434271.1 hypothetical protein HBH93_121280 [Parastagonospora nodorum]KAH4446370.1 hypothetical protein HBH91_146290 [Parastagonospora nodorum]KAH4504079.1 hypothetical protein HBH89_094710 [Parastagonospora nodorum]KAH4526103.1 hypothetical protein HBH85_218490 [Parastagonospora nodorum]
MHSTRRLLLLARTYQVSMGSSTANRRPLDGSYPTTSPCSRSVSTGHLQMLQQVPIPRPSRPFLEPGVSLISKASYDSTTGLFREQIFRRIDRADPSPAGHSDAPQLNGGSERKYSNYENQDDSDEAPKRKMYNGAGRGSRGPGWWPWP